MTIEELVEEMEENESEVECVWCNELCSKEDCHYDEEEGYICPDCQESTVKCTFCDGLFGKDQCRYEVDLGWLCSRCEMGIKSRGETLTFREGSYWDFLDEDVEPLDEKKGKAKKNHSHLEPCPECGEKTLDSETDICITCGFMA
jgi:hypothetical protein